MLTLVGMKKYSILLSILILGFYSCSKDSKAPLDEPEIVFTGISHDQIVNGSPQDTVLINLRYTMAVDAVGTKNDPTQVVLSDSRDQSNQSLTFPIEMQDNLPEGASNVSGNITITLPGNLFFIARPTKPDGDTLYYSIYIEDKDNIQSNIVTTPEIIILP